MIPFGIGAFFARPLVKYLGGALLIGLMIWFAVNKWNNFKDGLIEEGRLAGRAEVTAEFEALVAENNRVNREVEQRVDGALTNFADRVDQVLRRLRVQEGRIAGDIMKQINRNPQIFDNRTCDTPQETIDSRNAIRRLGPTRQREPLPTADDVVKVTRHNGRASNDGTLTIDLD
jgi:hypothetical protein